MSDVNLSCVDCGSRACRGRGGTAPEFCLTDHMDPELLAESVKLYQTEPDHTVLRTAAEIEHDGYCKWCRVRETVEFARRMGFRRIGIATCVGLIPESRTLAKILRGCGFEVFGVGCKAGTVPKTSVGIPERCTEVGVNICNPIMQAKYLNSEKTELNIVMGLCVGHDAMFYKYSEALVTTLVAKDRVTGNNPAAALYTTHSYFKNLFDIEFGPLPEDEAPQP